MISNANRSPRILVVGDLMIDHYVRGASTRLSSEAPVPIVAVDQERVTLGGAGNVLENLRALGADVRIAAVVGDDPTGREVLRLIHAKGVPTDSVLTVPGRRTSRKTRVLASHQQVVRLDRDSRQSIDHCVAAKLAGAPDQLDPPPAAILLSDHDQGALTPDLVQAIIAWARSHSVPVLVDPKGTSGAKYRQATIVTPNRREAALLTGITLDDDAAVRRAGAVLRQMLAARYVVITLSEQGMILFGESITSLPAVAREVYDVTGAGDTVLATLGFFLACGIEIQQAVRLANSAAAVAVSRLGSAAVTLDELLEYESTRPDGDPTVAIQTPATIGHLARQLQRQGKTVVFTNGCFDLLHRGHVEYLKASRACGDRLIVGLNSDASVRRLKGSDRPVMNEADRAYILAALSCVDYVVVFDTDTPYELIRHIQPDVLTKGGDYTAREQVVGHDLVHDVRLISLVEGKSTTRTINHIQRAA